MLVMEGIPIKLHNDGAQMFVRADTNLAQHEIHAEATYRNLWPYVDPIKHGRPAISIEGWTTVDVNVFCLALSVYGDQK
jgi:hypothetical protein